VAVRLAQRQRLRPAHCLEPLTSSSASSTLASRRKQGRLHSPV
jgi:hypothetical protein